MATRSKKEVEAGILKNLEQLKDAELVTAESVVRMMGPFSGA